MCNVIENIKNIEYVLVRLGILVLLIASCFGGCDYLNKKFGLNNDNNYEQKIEEFIEEETGLNIDLTP